MSDNPLAAGEAGSSPPDLTEQMLLNEERLRQAVRVSGLGVFEHDHRTDVIHWSGEMRQLHGFGPDDPITIPDILNTVYPDDRQMMAAAISKAHDPAGDGLYAIEHRIVRRDGSLRWLSRTSQTFFEGEGPSRRMVRTIGAAMDITDRRQAEAVLRRSHGELEQKVRERTAELAESEERFLRVFRTTPTGVLLTRQADGLVMDINDACLRAIGYSEAEVVGRTTLELNAWANPPDRDRMLALVRDHGRADELEVQIRHKSGRLLDVLLSATPLELCGIRCLVVSFLDITDRKRAENELRASEERHRTILQAAMDGFWISDIQGRLLEVNDAYCRMSGYSPRELLAMRIADLEAQITAEDLPGHIQEVMALGQGRFESQHRRKDGSVFDVEVSVQYQPGNGGRGVIFLRDITDRKRAEAALRASEAHLANVFRISPIGVCLIRLADGRFFDVNEAYLRAIGRSAEELVGRTTLDLNLWADPEARERMTRALRENGRIDSLEAQFRRKDGEIIDVLLSVLLTDRYGEPCILGTVMDITDRKRAEAALRENEEKYRRFFTTVSDAIHIFDAETLQVLEMNEAATRLYGYTREEGLRLWAPDLTAEPEKSAQSWARVLDQGADHIPLRLMKKKDGTVFPAEISACSFVLNGRPAICGLVRDITDRKRAEERLQASNRMLEELTTQLRLLASRLTQAERLERQRIGALIHDEVQQLLAAAHLRVHMLGQHVTGAQAGELVSQAGDILTQAIAISRSLAYEISPPVMRDIGLSAALDWLAEDVQAKHGLPVRVLSETEIPEDSEGVCDLLYQCARELLLNVVKHARAKSATISIRRVGEQLVQVVVADDGAGFDPGKVGAAKGARRGLGLVSIRERVGLRGGRLVIDSAPGQGSRLTLEAAVIAPARGDRLSACPSAAKQPRPGLRPDAQAESLCLQGAPAPRIRVLLADDHVMMRQGLAEILGTEDDLEIVGQAADGAQAVHLAAELNPDVVVMDARMPGMNGLDATRRIKAARPGVQVIGLSLYGEPKTGRAMREAGAAVVLAKDGPIETLAAAIRAAAMARRLKG